MHVCQYRWGLGAETWGLENKPREKTGVGYSEAALKGLDCGTATIRGVHRRSPGLT